MRVRRNPGPLRRKMTSWPPRALRGAVVFHKPPQIAELTRAASSAPARMRAMEPVDTPLERLTSGAMVSTLLSAIRRGETGAVDELFCLLYPDLRQMAHSRLRRSGHLTLLDTTGLVHEAYLRLFKAGSLEADDRSQFMAYSARVMRSVVVD